MLTINALNSNVINRANENNSHEYKNFLMLKNINIFSEIMNNTKNDSKLVPSVDDDKTSANIPNIKLDSKLNISRRMISQK